MSTTKHLQDQQASNAGGSVHADADGSAHGNPNLGDAAGVIPLIDDVSGALSGNGMPDPTTLAGDLLCIDCLIDKDPVAPDGPVLATLAAIENHFVDDFHALLEGSASQFGYPATPVLHELTAFGEAVGFGEVGESPNLLSSIAATPAAVLDGQAVAAACDIVDEAGSDGIELGRAVSGAAKGGPLVEAMFGDDSGTLLGAAVYPAQSSNGTLIQVDAASDGSSSQSHNLIDVGLGPNTQHSGEQQQGTIEILNPGPGGNPGAFEVDVLNVSADGPRLLDANVATDENALDVDDLDEVVLPDVADASSGDVADLIDVDILDLPVAALPAGGLPTFQHDLFGV